MWVLERQHIEFMRYRKDHMKVVGGEKFSLARGEPLLACFCLTLRAMAVAAGVIRDSLMTAARTGVHMAAESRRAAVLNGPESFELLKTEVLLVPVQKAVALCAKDVGHLHGGAAHFCLVRWYRRSEAPVIDRCSSGLTVFSRCRRDKCK